jgi:hypothetical protein
MRKCFLKAILMCFFFKEPDVVVHSCNPSTQEAEVERFQVHSQLGLHSETMSQNKATRRMYSTRSGLYVICFLLGNNWDTQGVQEPRKEKGHSVSYTNKLLESEKLSEHASVFSLLLHLLSHFCHMKGKWRLEEQTGSFLPSWNYT